MLNIGLTGGISTGKTTVAGLLVEKGAYLIDFDELAHQVQLPGTEVWRAILDAFGSEVIGSGQKIDRNKLGSIVFSDPAKLRSLNRIVHPAVFEAWKKRLGEIEAERPDAIVLSDVPLLIEIGAQKMFDLVLLVYVTRAEQLERLIQRNGYSREYAEKRIGAQMPIEEKLSYAQIVVSNCGTLAETRRRVDEIWTDLVAYEREKHYLQTLNRRKHMIHSNVITDFSAVESAPVIDATAYVHPLGCVIGNVVLGKNVMVAPFACVRGDEGQPLHVGDDSNVQDGVVIHALETEEHGKPVEKNLMTVEGKKYAVYIGNRVSLAHQVQVHGPSVVLDDSFIGMQALVFKSFVNKRCVVEPGCILMGVTVPEGRYVPAGTVLRSQQEADALPLIGPDYPLKDLNKGVVHVNTSLAAAYLKKGDSLCCG